MKGTAGAYPAFADWKNRVVAAIWQAR